MLSLPRLMSGGGRGATGPWTGQMKTILLTALALVSALLTASCDVTGTAPPDSAYAQPGVGGNSIGDPGFGSP